MSIVTKPEENEDFIRIPVAQRQDSDTIRTINIDAKKGITALYAANREKILTYIFNKKKYPWTMESARQWIRDHKEAKSMDLITSRLKLKDVLPEVAKNVAKEYNLKEDDVEFIRKGITPEDLEIEEGERAVISYITTGAVDRDGEIVDPRGGVLRDYKKNPVVLFGHDYRSLPVGKNVWIKRDEKGLIAKTVYAKHEEAEKVFQYRKDGFPLAESIGFVPIEYENLDSEEKQRKNGGARRKYNKWLLLEYSDVPVPSNPEALALAVAKGLLPKEELKNLEPDVPEISKEELELIQKNVETKEGRILSNKTRNVIKQAIDVLQELYNASEPKKEDEEKVIEEIPEVKDVNEFVEKSGRESDLLNKVAADLQSIIEKLK